MTSKLSTRSTAGSVLVSAAVVLTLGFGSAASATAGPTPAGAGQGSSSASPSGRPNPAVSRHEARPPSHRPTDPEEATTIVSDTSGPYMYNQKNGAVQTDPRIYLIYWGDWSQDTYGAMNRLYYFYRGIGGSAWGNVPTQYQQACTAGTYSCTGAHAGNPTAPFKSYYKDTSYVPTTPTEADIKNEAKKMAANVFKDFSANAQYVVALPPGHGDSRFAAKGGDACAWHSYFWNSSTSWGTVTSLPYQPDWSRCYMNSVNAGSAGVLDGVSMVAGHEYVESVTDPGLNAWYDNAGAENGDKCSSYGANVSFSSGTFPVQAQWSNYHKYYNGSGCRYSM